MPTKIELEKQLETQKLAFEQLRQEKDSLEVQSVELAKQLAALVEELAQKQEVIEEYREALDAAHTALSERDAQIAEFEIRNAKETSDEINTVISRRCINCGNSGRTTYDAESERFTCAFCKYSWAMEAETYPFRQQ